MADGVVVRAVDSGIRIGDEGQIDGAHTELGGKRNLRVHGHVDDVAAGCRVPPRFGARREARTLDDDRGPARKEGLACRGQRLACDGKQRGVERIRGREMLHRAAVGGGPVEEGVRTPGRAVEELVGEHERPGRVLGGQPAHGRARDDRRHPERGQGPDVCAVRDEVRGDRVVDAVAGEEDDIAVGKTADHDRRRPVRGLDPAGLGGGGVEQPIEAGTADDANARCAHCRPFVCSQVCQVMEEGPRWQAPRPFCTSVASVVRLLQDAETTWRSAR